MQKINSNIVMPELTEFQISETAQLSGMYGRDNMADQILKDIDLFSELAYREPEPRSHLGASIIGHECERYIWFAFRWMKIEFHKARMLRLFRRGHREEDFFFELLQGIGFHLQSVDIDGKQIRIASEIEGHFGGSVDAIGSLPERYRNAYKGPILVECKTANARQFADMQNLGIFKAKERYYKQACVYGYKMNIPYVLFVIVNKNTDEIMVELLELDLDLGKAEIDKAEKIINAYYPPPRLTNDPSYYKCGWCPMKGICHLDKPVDKNCRSCRFAQPVADAQWFCHRWQQIIPKEAIIKGCEGWESLPR